MAIQSKQAKTKLRRLSNRRKQQVQRQSNQAFQELKTLVDGLQAAVDSYRYARSERVRRLIRANIHLRFRALTRALHYALPEQLLPKERIQSLRLEAEAGSIQRSSRADFSFGSANECGGISGDARASLSDDFRVTPIRRKESV